MLSILIPIYNFDITGLVKELELQCNRSEFPIEIICVDDASSEAYKLKNRLIEQIPFVNYLELDTNIGRSKIRNLLARKSKYEFLLFLDCDSQIISGDFIKIYVEKVARRINHVIFGGTKYSATRPHREVLLHWHYGTKREALSAQRRSKDPYTHFHTNNFLTPRDLFLEYPLNEEIDGYGYEDLEWAFQLKAEQVPIMHINNPVLHLGLKDNKSFLEGQKSATINLSRLYKSGKISSTRLIRAYNRLNNWHLISILKYLPLHSPSLLRISSLRLKILDLRKVLYFDEGAVNKY